MEVLRHGKNWEITHNIITCDCGCKYIYNEDDAEDLKTSVGGFRYAVICPECGSLYYIYLSRKEEEDKSFVEKNAK